MNLLWEGHYSGRNASGLYGVFGRCRGISLRSRMTLKSKLKDKDKGRNKGKGNFPTQAKRGLEWGTRGAWG